MIDSIASIDSAPPERFPRYLERDVDRCYDAWLKRRGLTDSANGTAFGHGSPQFSQWRDASRAPKPKRRTRAEFNAERAAERIEQARQRLIEAAGGRTEFTFHDVAHAYGGETLSMRQEAARKALDWARRRGLLVIVRERRYGKGAHRSPKVYAIAPSSTQPRDGNAG